MRPYRATRRDQLASLVLNALAFVLTSKEYRAAARRMHNAAWEHLACQRELL